jgi:hypothetical protein
MNNKCIQTLHEWYEFYTLANRKKLSGLLYLALTNSKTFPASEILLSIVPDLTSSTVYCERGFSLVS